MSAAANFLFLRPLAELAMINTSQMMTNGTQNLLQKKIDQNWERRSQFSDFEATSWASYAPHILNCDK